MLSIPHGNRFQQEKSTIFKSFFTNTASIII